MYSTLFKSVKQMISFKNSPQFKFSSHCDSSVAWGSDYAINPCPLTEVASVHPTEASKHDVAAAVILLETLGLLRANLRRYPHPVGDTFAGMHTF